MLLLILEKLLIKMASKSFFEFTLKAGEKSPTLMSFRLFLIEKLNNFKTENWLKIHEQIKLLLKSQSVVQSAYFYVDSFRF